MPKINPSIPTNSVQYFSNARGVNYLPSLDSEWKQSGYLPRPDFGTALDLYVKGALDSLTLPAFFTELGTAPTKIFVGVNAASIWHYYDESDHEKGIIKLKDLGVNCIRTPLFYDVYHFSPTSYLNNVKNFLRVCDKHKMRVQFVLWDSEQSLRMLTSDNGDIFTEQTTPDLTTALSFEKPRNPNITLAASPSFFTASAGPYLDALASSVSSYQSMWCFDLCNKPISEFYDLVVSSHSRLNQSLSSTNIKYTFSPKDGLNIFNDTGYLDNGKGTGPSGSYGIEDITTFSGLIDFVSVPFIANNDYAFKRYLNGAISGTTAQGISKPFMVYAAYDPELSQNLNTTLDTLKVSSIGYFNDLGLIDNAFSFGSDKLKFGNIYSDGQFRDLGVASSMLSEGLNANWFNRRDLTKAIRLQEKGDDSFSGTSNNILGLDREVSPKAVEAWDILKNYYVNAGDNLLKAFERSKQASQKFKAGFDSQFSQSINHNVMASSFNDNSLEENLRILYNFDTHFPPLSGFTFAVAGDNWQKINESMIIRNGFLQSLAKFVIDYDSNTVGYAELRNTQYDTNPIPHYDRSVLVDLVEVMTNPYRYVNRNPTTDKLSDLSSTKAWEFSEGVYGVSDSGADFSEYYDQYYTDLVAQLKRCLMWIYREGQSNSDFKIVSNSFLSDISFEASSLSSVEVYGTTPQAAGDYTAGSLDSLKSPYFGVEVYDPSSSSWVSSFVFQASGVGQYRQLVDGQVTGDYSSLRNYWAPSGSNPCLNFTTFGTSGLADIRISYLPASEGEGGGGASGFPASTTVYVFPSRSNKTRQLAFNADLSTFEGTVYIGDKLWIEFSNDDLTVSTPLFIFADPFKPPVPVGLQSYQGETRADHLSLVDGQTAENLTSATNAWDTINWGTPGNPTVFSSLQPGTYFGPGIHYVSAGLPISSNSTYYIDANAYIIGGFDCASAHNSKITGRGVFSPGELYPRDFLFNAKEAIFEEVPTFYGPFGASWSSMNEYASNEGSVQPDMKVDGIVVTNHGFWASGRKIIKSFDNCKALIPWTYNSDGFKPSSYIEGGTNSLKNSIMLCGDDQIACWDSKFENEVENINVVVGSMRTGCFFKFTTNSSSTYYTVNKDIDIYSYAAPGSHPNQSVNSFNRNAIFMFYNPESTLSSVINYNVGYVNGIFEDIHIEGGDGSSVYHPLFRLGNMVMPSTGQQNPPGGNMSNLEFTNINIVPNLNSPSSTNMSGSIVGLSATRLPGQTLNQDFNRPQDLTMTNLKIAQSPPTFMISDNVDDYISWYEPLSGTNSVTDPDSVDGSSANIVFKTT